MSGRQNQFLDMLPVQSHGALCLYGSRGWFNARFCHLEILHFELRSPTFSFCTGPQKVCN